jgi:hypothetical protein
VPYLATGESWTVDIHEAGVPGGRAAMLGAVLAEARLVDLDQVNMSRLGLRLAEDDFRELQERIEAILEEYADRPSDPDGRAYSVFVACYPDVSREGPAAAD